jgi:hypothetical protein
VLPMAADRREKRSVEREKNVLKYIRLYKVEN